MYMPSNHFVVNVHVEEVTYVEKLSGTAADRFGPKVTERLVDETARLVVKADTLDEVRAKVNALLAAI